jgi:outer membrane biosynthesis protein TonB
LKERQKPHERALEEAVSRALRDNLSPLQRTADELHQAYSDLVAACSSSRPTNALPAMLRAQTAAAALAAGLSVLSNFVAVALNPREQHGEDGYAQGAAVAEMEAPVEEVEEEVVEEAPAPPAAKPSKAKHKPEPEPEPEAEEKSEWAEEPEDAVPASKSRAKAKAESPVAEPEPEAEPETEPVHAAKVAVEEPAPARKAAFDVASLPSDMQDLHRRANRVAKVAMQDIKLLRPKDVRLGRENKDICQRLRSDLDKARKEYDRRFRTILDHPVDYFHRWMVEVLAEGDEAALGEYPYPSPVLRT